MSTYLTSGFVLRSSPWREHDRLYRVFTDHYGKLELIAAGSRKIVSKLSPHLQPFCDVEIMVARGKKIDRLAAAHINHIYLKAPYESAHTTVAAALLELTDHLTEVEQPEPGLHQLLCNSLRQAATLPSEPTLFRPAARLLISLFIMEALHKVGLAVSFSRCDYCKQELQEPVDYSWTRHGFCHRACAKDDTALAPLSATVLGWLRQGINNQVTSSNELPPTVLGFLTDYVTGHTGRSICTLKVLRSII